MSSVAVLTSAVLQRTDLPLSNIGNPVVIATCMGLSALIRTSDESALLAGWCLMGSIAAVVIFGPEDVRATGDFAGLYKFSLAPLLIAVCLFLACRVRGHGAACLIVFFAAVLVSPLLDARGPALIALIALLVWRVSAANSGLRTMVRRIILTVTVLAVAAPLLLLIVKSGALGTAAQERTERQTQAGASILLGGRTEPPLSIAAIASKPLFGWGNVNEIDLDTVATGQHIASALGNKYPSRYMSFWIRADGQISLHSIFLTLWVEGGLVAALFPFLALFILTCGAFRARGRYAPFMIYVCTESVWDLLFSPWSEGRTLFIALSLIVAVEGLSARPSQYCEEGVSDRPREVRRLA